MVAKIENPNPKIDDVANIEAKSTMEGTVVADVEDTSDSIEDKVVPKAEDTNTDMKDKGGAGVDQTAIKQKKDLIKDIFDNIRNMLISGSIFYAAKFVWNIKCYETVMCSIESAEFYLLMSLGAILMILNVYHALLILRYDRSMKINWPWQVLFSMAIIIYVSLSLDIAFSKVRDLPMAVSG